MPVSQLRGVRKVEGDLNDTNVFCNPMILLAEGSLRFELCTDRLRTAMQKTTRRVITG